MNQLKVGNSKQKKQRIQALNKKLNKNLKKEIYLDTLFIRQHKNTFAGLNILYHRSLGHPLLPIKDLIRLFNFLSSEIQKTEKGIRLKKLLFKNRATQVGSKILSFNLVNLHNDSVELPFFDKFLLIAFWASWCRPCLQDFPKMKEIYNSYSRDLEIINISIDKDTALYRKAVRKEGINNWINGLMNKEIRSVFYIPAIPMKYLINKEGIIIGRWRGGGSDNMISLITTLEKYIHP